jgi:hypothetical protein
MVDDARYWILDSATSASSIQYLASASQFSYKIWPNPANCDTFAPLKFYVAATGKD